MHVDYIIGNEDTGFPGMLRSYLDEPVDDQSDWDQTELLAYVNLEHKHLFSVQRNYNENWFGRVAVFPLVASQYEYFLPMDCVNPLRIEFISASSVTGTTPFYIVNEDTANPQEVGEVKLAGNRGYRYSNTNYYGRRFSSGYFLFDDTLNFEPNQEITSSMYCRIFYAPQAPDLHRGVAQAATSTTITLASNAADTTVGVVRNIDQYYQRMRIEIVSGTGAGDIRRITKYVGSTGIATVESAWSTTPDSSSVYSIVSPIQEDYQELLIFGGAIRAKGIKVEDDVSTVGMLYAALRTDMDNNLDTRNQQYVRSVNQTRGD